MFARGREEEAGRPGWDDGSHCGAFGAAMVFCRVAPPALEFSFVVASRAVRVWGLGSFESTGLLGTSSDF